jgi:hypothetical protein
MAMPTAIGTLRVPTTTSPKPTRLTHDTAISGATVYAMTTPQASTAAA